MDLLLHNEDLRSLIETAVEGKLQVKAVECAPDQIRVRVALGILPASVEFTDFRLDGHEFHFRVVGAVATKLLGMFRHRVEQTGARVDGEWIQVPLPDAVRQAMRVRALSVGLDGVRLQGDLMDLSHLVT
ncbi:MAG: hypothetical protein H7A45_07925 [Verrucomicrobiales bacterium]|nr:hypothetical protein [Verrucomicrobiales bacterium]MCP5527156.1 hypothetical protein [Verrucomicrobiales bacterium]